ncbi:unnamed protein product, partial [Chondrus crispus]
IGGGGRDWWVRRAQGARILPAPRHWLGANCSPAPDWPPSHHPFTVEDFNCKTELFRPPDISSHTVHILYPWCCLTRSRASRPTLPPSPPPPHLANGSRIPPP